MGVREPVPLSVLDLATVRAGGTSAQALAETTELARAADRLGYRRFWVAEHHNIDTVASTSPAVLIAHLAAHTERIKLGSGGVMLPNHRPAVVAEQFAMLEALHPGRIDLGVGRAPGSDRATAAAIRGPTQHDSSDGHPAPDRSQPDRAQPDPWQIDDFPSHLIDLMAYLGDVRAADGPWTDFRATPLATSAPAVVLLGSSGYSAQLAGYLGLPFAFAHHFDGGGVLGAVDLYRQRFQPSAVLDAPYVMVSVGLVTAADSDTAGYHAAPSLLRRWGIRTGRFWPLAHPDDAMSHPEWHRASAMPTNAIVGDPSEAVDGLQALAAATGAAELMVHTSTFGLAERITSLELLAEAWQRSTDEPAAAPPAAELAVSVAAP
ncbi:LLM class flavin-dependent oxidoreductase [Candidatus Poriferisodalis sp.]|uniref:LLM class flavin-dependent oxidoreductase n=1 Tax=Candidatus Poriferisodalis sp. TaxID=3101277 RepID=UPI003B02095B